ncbi:hypothetical protein Q3G72_002324 [Acer saccharum]|nr:hypothetical protein Q3G72_002324 [Acer saccharum]
MEDFVCPTFVAVKSSIEAFKVMVHDIRLTQPKDSLWERNRDRAMIQKADVELAGESGSPILGLLHGNGRLDKRGKKGSLLISSSTMAYSSFDKGKSTYIKAKKHVLRPKESCQGSLVIGKQNTCCHLVESSSDDSLLGFEAEGCSSKAQVLANSVAYEGRLCIYRLEGPSSQGGNISKLVDMVKPLIKSLSRKDLPGQPNPMLDFLSTKAGLGPSLHLHLEDVVHPCKDDGNEDRHESEVGFGELMRSPRVGVLEEEEGVSLLRRLVMACGQGVHAFYV